MDVAFEGLRRLSRSNNLRLSEVARRVVAGELTLEPVTSDPPSAVRP